MEQDNNLHILNPTRIETTDRSYDSVSRLIMALDNPEIKNIALTGPYGSGKSSVLKTLQEDANEYEFLNISLATLDPNDSLVSENPGEEDGGKDSEPQFLNRLIEYSILQQIIYKEKQEKIPQSRFKRIKHISEVRSHAFAVSFVAFILAILIIIKPDWIANNQLIKMFSCSGFLDKFWGFVALGYVAYALYKVVKYLSVALYNNNLNKINLKDGEIEIAETTSIFNKHLDEILYFFEVTEYNVVIFEDLDRFKNHHIFLKLRELNQLINESKSVTRRDKRPIVFIYAVRDDLFKDTSRTKFFDYIVTVIPVINSSNACDILLSLLKQSNETGITERVCRELGTFIDDMRTLKNIVNEYLQYRERLEQLVPKKLLGMIVYKNYYPEDFAKLHNGEGIVYTVMDQESKQKYVNAAIREINSKIEKLQNDILLYENLNKVNLRELRALYVMKYIEQNSRIERFVVNNTSYTYTQIIDSEELFSHLKADEIKEYQRFNSRYSNPYESVPLDIKFSDIEKLLDLDRSYETRKKLLTPSEVGKLKIEQTKLEKEKIEIRETPIRNILNRYGDDEFNTIVGTKNKLILFLIQQGYIEEDYYDYISYFYPGTLTPSDKSFLLDVMTRKKNEYDQKLIKLDALTSQIPRFSYKHESILNYSLLNYIIDNLSSYKTEFDWITDLVKSNRKFDFLKGYYEFYRSNTKQDFYYSLFSKWDNFWNELIDRKEIGADINLFAEIFLRFRPTKNSRKDNILFCEYMSNNYLIVNSIASKYGSGNILSIIKELDVKFEQLEYLGEVDNILYNIIQGCHYQLSIHNIEVVLSYLARDREVLQRFSSASYTTIVESGNKPLVEYIELNIETCLDELFPYSSIDENESVLIRIADSESISIQTKMEYLGRQKSVIRNIASVSLDFWDNILEINKIYPSWENIFSYFALNESKINNILVRFINVNIDVIVKTKLPNSIISESGDNFFIEMFSSNIIDIQSYKLLFRLFNRQFNSIDNLTSLEKDRMLYLIEIKGVKFNAENCRIIETNWGDDVFVRFLISNKDQMEEAIYDLEFTGSQLKALLCSNDLSFDQKEELINSSLMPDHIDKTKDLADVVCGLLGKVTELRLDLEFAIKVLAASEQIDPKVRFANKILMETSKGIAYIPDVLVALGGKYKELTEKGPKPSFLKSTNNMKLFDFLKSNDYISGVFPKEHQVKVTTKTK